MTLIKSAIAYQKAQGFTLFEMVVVSGIIISFMSLGSKYITQNIERAGNQITAQHLQQVTQAAQYYVQDYYQQLSQNIDTSITWESLKDNGYISESLAELNHYNQNYQFTLQKDKGFLQLLLTTHGGQVINENNLRKIVTMAGSQAGYTTLLHPNKIIGHQENWSIDIDDTVDSGHIASLTIINEKEVVDAANFLRKTELSGHTEYNRMDADLQISDSKKIFFEENNGFQLTQFQLKSINNKNNSTVTIENTDAPSLIFKQKGIGQAKLTDNSLSFRSDNGSFINIQSGVNKYFTISYPDGDHMRLWANYLALYNDDTNNKIELSTQYKTDTPKIKVTGEGWGGITKNSSVESLSNYAEINPKFIKIPTYIYKPGEFSDGGDLVEKVCMKAGQGALFLIVGYGTLETTLVVCHWNRSALMIRQASQDVKSREW